MHLCVCTCGSDDLIGYTKPQGYNLIGCTKCWRNTGIHTTLDVAVSYWWDINPDMPMKSFFMDKVGGYIVKEDRKGCCLETRNDVFRQEDEEMAYSVQEYQEDFYFENRDAILARMNKIFNNSP